MQLFCRIRRVDVVLELRLVMLWLVTYFVARLVLRSLPQFRKQLRSKSLTVNLFIVIFGKAFFMLFTFMGMAIKLFLIKILWLLKVSIDL